MKTPHLNLISTFFSPPNPLTYEITFFLVNVLQISLSLYLGEVWYHALLSFWTGIFSWILLEYLMHRFVFHHRSQHLLVRKMVYAIHGVHHAHPKDHDKLYVPLVPALIINLILLSFFCVLLGWLGLPFTAGLFTMHQFYNLVHYMIHTNAFPNNPYLARLRANHLKHHTGHGEKCFGVTSTIFDRIFGTH